MSRQLRGYEEVVNVRKLQGGDPCCTDPDDPCCGSEDPCCGSEDPCCGSTDPCCVSRGLRMNSSLSIFSSHTTFCVFRDFYRGVKIHVVVAAAAAVVKRIVVDQVEIHT